MVSRDGVIPKENIPLRFGLSPSCENEGTDLFPLDAFIFLQDWLGAELGRGMGSAGSLVPEPAGAIGGGAMFSSRPINHD
jgi:hypothetical protein